MAPQTCHWATGATAYSSYSNDCNTGQSQNSCEVIGAPDVAPSCGDVAGAWSPAQNAGARWLQASYDQILLVHRITIYETYRAPFVNSVEAINSATNSPTTVWQGTDTTTCGSSLEILIPNGVLADRIKVNTVTSGFPQIDAVQICGIVVPSPPLPPPSPPAPPMMPPPCSGQIDLVMVLDNSGSVGSARPDVLTFARQVVGFFEMGATAAQIGYVEFETTVRTLSTLTPSLSTISTALDTAPNPTGSDTCLRGGINQGQAVLTGTGARTGVPKVLVLMSDGVPNTCGTQTEVISAATTIKNAGTKIITVGFGAASVTLLNQVASSPASTYALYQTYAQDFVNLIANGEFDICVTATDQPRGPPPSPPSPPTPPPPPSPPAPPTSPPESPPPPPIDCAYCSDLYTAFGNSQSTITAAGACPSGSIADTDGAGRNLCKMWVDGRMWFVPRE